MLFSIDLIVTRASGSISVDFVY